MTSQPPTPPILPEGPQPKPPVYKRGWFIVLAIFLGLGFLGNLFEVISDQSPTAAPTSEADSTKVSTAPNTTPPEQEGATTAPSTTEAAPATTIQPTTTTTVFVPGIGDAVIDGQFEFTVTDFECGFESLGEGFFEAIPNGKYCVLSITVQNVGDSPRFYSFDEQKLIDTADRLISSDFDGSFALDSDNATSELNPGVGIETSVAFDVSKDATTADFAFAELHDSFLSFGAEVALN